MVGDRILCGHDSGMVEHFVVDDDGEVYVELRMDDICMEGTGQFKTLVPLYDAKRVALN
jgi:hypothetical protein